MCFGSGGNHQYDAWNHGYDQFTKNWGQWARQDLKDARHGADFGDLNDYENYANFKHRIAGLSRDPQADMNIREMIRQHSIDLGKIAIDKNFNQFDNGYYKDYRKDYTNYYDPQVQDQYHQTNDKLVGSLADRGMLESSVGNSAQADLFKKLGEAKTNISNEALDAANKLRSNVQSAKSNLYSLNEASADPMGVNAQAVGSATALVQPPTYSPLGQLFTSALNPWLSYTNAAQNTPMRTYVSPYNNVDGSGKVIY
jgi:hypothetical protein